MNRDTKIQKLREAIAAQTTVYPTIWQAETIFDAVFEEPEWEYAVRDYRLPGYIILGENPLTETERRMYYGDRQLIRRTKAGDWEERR